MNKNIFNFKDSYIVSIEHHQNKLIIKIEDATDQSNIIRNGIFKITDIKKILIEDKPADRIELEHQAGSILFLKFTNNYLKMSVEWNCFDTENFFIKYYEITAAHIEWIPDETSENEKQDD